MQKFPKCVPCLTRIRNPNEVSHTATGFGKWGQLLVGFTRERFRTLSKKIPIYIYWFVKLLLANSFSYFGECFVVNV